MPDIVYLSTKIYIAVNCSVITWKSTVAVLAEGEEGVNNEAYIDGIRDNRIRWTVRGTSDDTSCVDNPMKMPYC